MKPILIGLMAATACAVASGPSFATEKVCIGGKSGVIENPEAALANHSAGGSLRISLKESNWVHYSIPCPHPNNRTCVVKSVYVSITPTKSRSSEAFVESVHFHDGEFKRLETLRNDLSQGNGPHHYISRDTLIFRNNVYLLSIGNPPNEGKDPLFRGSVEMSFKLVKATSKPVSNPIWISKLCIDYDYTSD